MSQFFDEFEAAIDEAVPPLMLSPREGTPRRTPSAEAEMVDDDESAVAASDIGSAATPRSSTTPNSKKQPVAVGCLGCRRGRTASCFYRSGCEVQWALKMGRGDWCLDCHIVWRTMESQDFVVGALRRAVEDATRT